MIGSSKKLKLPENMRNSSIIYVNYSPYENSGHILDYLLENFDRVYLFSIAFHSLGNKTHLNKFTIYQNGKLVKNENLYYMKIPQSMVFILIPIRSLMNGYQLMSKIFSIRRKYGPVDVFFTVNAFTATLGRVFKMIGLVNRTVFWVWDYYPITHSSLHVRIMRWLYWQFDKFATYSDKVIYLNRRMADVREKAGVINKVDKAIVIPIATGDILPVKKKSLSTIKIGFIGVLKKSQGVDMLIDSAEVLSKNFKRIVFEIIGSGPDESIFKKRAKNLKNVKYNFYGLVSESQFKRILYSSTIGIAPYMPDESTVSKYTDPGKPKRYLEFNLPNISTDVIEFSKQLKSTGAGEIVKYGDLDQLVVAIKRIVQKYDTYVDSAVKLNRKFHYRNLYKNFFN